MPETVLDTIKVNKTWRDMFKGGERYRKTCNSSSSNTKK